MYLFQQKLDQFTAFAKQQVSIHAKEICIPFARPATISRNLKEELFRQHQQMLELELALKIDELSNQYDSILRPSLGILKNYYLTIFKISTQDLPD